MWRTLGISESDWQQTPPAVQTKLRSQYHETHSLKLRSVSAKKQIADLSEPNRSYSATQSAHRQPAKADYSSSKATN
jgi:hypothetical protein